jgi:hypothetical protein
MLQYNTSGLKKKIETKKTKVYSYSINIEDSWRGWGYLGYGHHVGFWSNNFWHVCGIMIKEFSFD